MYFWTVFSSHQNEPKPGMSLSSHRTGGAGATGGGGGADGGCPSQEPQVFLHRLFFSSSYFWHFLFLQLLSASTHSGGGEGLGGGGEGDGGEGLGGSEGLGGGSSARTTMVGTSSIVRPSAAEAAAAVPRVEASEVCTSSADIEAGTAMVAVMRTLAAVTLIVTSDLSTPAASATHCCKLNLSLSEKSLTLPLAVSVRTTVPSNDGDGDGGGGDGGGIGDSTGTYKCRAMSIGSHCGGQTIGLPASASLLAT